MSARTRIAQAAASTMSGPNSQLLRDELYQMDRDIDRLVTAARSARVAIASLENANNACAEADTDLYDALMPFIKD